LSPTRAKTTDEDVVAAARKIIAKQGVDALSLREVATAVGVRAPSLYKRFADRSDLLDAVRDDLLRDLARALAKVRSGESPSERLLAMARAYRRFGLAQPRLYRLIFASGGEPSAAARDAVSPVLADFGEIVGREHALSAARALTAFLNGFVTLEINGSFQLGGSIDDAFEFGLKSLLAGLAAATKPKHG
jgi:AcrR family transcriptional regulator